MRAATVSLLRARANNRRARNIVGRPRRVHMYSCWARRLGQGLLRCCGEGGRRDLVRYICTYVRASRVREAVDSNCGLGSEAQRRRFRHGRSRPPRDRSYSASRSVVFRVEIGLAPARGRRSAPEHALGACSGAEGGRGEAAGVEVCARCALWDWWHSPPVGCSTSMCSARAPGLDRTSGSRAADCGTRRSRRAMTGTGAGKSDRGGGRRTGRGWAWTFRVL